MSNHFTADHSSSGRSLERRPPACRLRARPAFSLLELQLAMALTVIFSGWATWNLQRPLQKGRLAQAVTAWRSIDRDARDHSRRTRLPTSIVVDSATGRLNARAPNGWQLAERLPQGCTLAILADVANDPSITRRDVSGSGSAPVAWPPGDADQNGRVRFDATGRSVDYRVRFECGDVEQEWLFVGATGQSIRL